MAESSVIDIPRELAAISAAYGVTVRLIARHFGEPTPGVPEAWQPILAAPDRQSRVAAAIELWPTEMRDLLPEFWEMLETDLYDVAAVRRGGEPALLYVTRETEEDPPINRFWFGHAPFQPETTPLGWDLHPPLMHTFLTESHGGFTLEDGESFGILPPRRWRNWAADVGWPDGIPGWDRDQVDSRSLIIIGDAESPTWLCLSPEFKGYQAAYVFEGQAAPNEYWSELDEFLTAGFLQEPLR